jgi:hypothetical protein
MKIFIFSTLLVIVFMNETFAQTIAPIPKKEFNVSLSQDHIEIRPGETKELGATLQRSRGYSKLNATMNLSSSLPDGVSVSFEPSNGVMENTKAIITVGETAKPGNYMIIINCNINHKNKGAMLKMIIKSSTDFTTGLN